MAHHFHELTLAQWGLIFGIINALLHLYIKYILNYIKIWFSTTISKFSITVRGV